MAGCSSAPANHSRGLGACLVWFSAILGLAFCLSVALLALNGEGTAPHDQRHVLLTELVVGKQAQVYTPPWPWQLHVCE